MRVLIPIVIANMIPPLIAAVSKPEALPSILLFAGVVLTWLFAFGRWLAERDEVWVKGVGLFAAWMMTTWYVALFSPMFSNAYLAYVMVVQIIFLTMGPRCGVIMLALSIVSDFYHLFLGHPITLAANFYAIAIEATVGVLSWVFVWAATSMKDDAQRSADEAGSAKERAEQLAADATSAQQEADLSRQEAEVLASEIGHLNRLILVSQDNERRRIARDIHDGPLQSMGVELLTVDRIRRHLQAKRFDKVESELQYLRDVAEETVKDLRATVNHLRNTLLDHDLELALQNLVRKIEGITGLQITLSIKIERHISDGLQNCLYQLAIETLNNVKKHARANKVVLAIHDSPCELLMSVQDDGQGFNYDSSLEHIINTGHIGLHSMKERAAEFGGSMSIFSAPGMGTEVRFCFPTSNLATTPLSNHHLPGDPLDKKKTLATPGLS
jgi:signal transduction histidine kinase